METDNRPPEDQIEAWQQAIEFLQEGQQLQQEGDLAGALAKYRLSLAFYPTAEAHTCQGWIYARLHLFELAIEACQQAIRVDPDYGNPYNDIGVCLVELGQLAEAVPWFEKAAVAPRYDARCYPFFNLGQVHEHLGDWPLAIRYFQQALDLEPDYQQARAAWQNLRAKLN